jgi:hypothetical protein
MDTLFKSIDCSEKNVMVGGDYNVHFGTAKWSTIKIIIIMMMMMIISRY